LVSAGDLIDLPETTEAKKQDLQTIVTGELSPEVRTVAAEEGINTIELGAFHSEEPGMKRLRYQLSLEFPELKIDFVDSPPISKSLRPYSQDMA
jgi:putative NIF3 family GTP cyclohydrolase 1 type 2